MSRKSWNYDTDRNSKTKEFTKGITDKRKSFPNASTIKMLFPMEMRHKMTAYDHKFIVSLGRHVGQWTEKQLVILKKIENRYKNNI